MGKRRAAQCSRQSDIGSSVGIATAYGPDDRRVAVTVPVEPRIFTSQTSRPDLRPTQPAIQWVPEASSYSLGRAKNLHFPNIETGSGAHPACYPMGTGG
jgi:hypothetical protein